MPTSEPTANGFFNGTVRVRSTAPVRVFASSYRSGTVESFLAIPSIHQGNEYFLVTREGPRPAQVVISAVEEPCEVYVYPTEAVEFDNITHPAGSPLTINLTKFESAVIDSDSDITGTRVVSSRKVSVVAGSVCANIPSSARNCDMVVEQLLPYELWGANFALAPFVGRESGYDFYVVAGRNDTVVRIGNEVVTLQSGEFLERTTDNGTMVLVNASRPVQVMQFQKGQSTDGVGDPSMTLVVPYKHYVSNALLYVVDDETSRCLDLYVFSITSRCEWFDSVVVVDTANGMVLEMVNVTSAGDMCSGGFGAELGGFYNITNAHHEAKFSVTYYAMGHKCSISNPASFSFVPQNEVCEIDTATLTGKTVTNYGVDMIFQVCVWGGGGGTRALFFRGCKRKNYLRHILNFPYSKQFPDTHLHVHNKTNRIAIIEAGHTLHNRKHYSKNPSFLRKKKKKKKKKKI